MNLIYSLDERKTVDTIEKQVKTKTKTILGQCWCAQTNLLCIWSRWLSGNCRFL